MTVEEIYKKVQHVENRWGKGKQKNNKASKNEQDVRCKGGKIKNGKRKRKPKQEVGSSIHEENGPY